MVELRLQQIAWLAIGVLMGTALVGFGGWQ